jgi:hypothetical protein
MALDGAERPALDSPGTLRRLRGGPRGPEDGLAGGVRLLRPLRRAQPLRFPPGVVADDGQEALPRPHVAAGVADGGGRRLLAAAGAPAAARRRRQPAAGARRGEHADRLRHDRLPPPPQPRRPRLPAAARPGRPLAGQRRLGLPRSRRRRPQVPRRRRPHRRRLRRLRSQGLQGPRRQVRQGGLPEPQHRGSGLRVLGHLVPGRPDRRHPDRAHHRARLRHLPLDDPVRRVGRADVHPDERQPVAAGPGW